MSSTLVLCTTRAFIAAAVLASIVFAVGTPASAQFNGCPPGPCTGTPGNHYGAPGFQTGNTSGGSVAVDAVGSELTNFPGAASVNYTGLTIGSGLTNSALLVTLVTGNQVTLPTATLTWNGTALSLISSTSINNAGASFQISLWGLVSPAAGNKTLAVSFGGVAYSHSIAAMSFQGVDQTTPFQNGTTNSGSSQTPSVSVTAAVGSISVGAYAASVAYNSVSPTQIFQDTTSSYPVGAADYAAGASPTLGSVLGSSVPWIASGVNVKAN